MVCKPYWRGLADHTAVPGTQPQRRAALPRLVEPAGLGQLVRGARIGEHLQGSAGADGAELVKVPRRDQCRPLGGDDA